MGPRIADIKKQPIVTPTTINSLIAAAPSTKTKTQKISTQVSKEQTQTSQDARRPDVTQIVAKYNAIHKQHGENKKPQPKTQNHLKSMSRDFADLMLTTSTQ